MPSKRSYRQRIRLIFSDFLLFCNLQQTLLPQSPNFKPHITVWPIFCPSHPIRQQKYTGHIKSYCSDYHCTERFPFLDFFNICEQISRKNADLFTLFKEIFNGNLHFLCSVFCAIIKCGGFFVTPNFTRTLFAPYIGLFNPQVRAYIADRFSLLRVQKVWIEGCTMILTHFQSIFPFCFP